MPAALSCPDGSTAAGRSASAAAAAAAAGPSSSPRNSQMTYPGPLTSRFPSSPLAQRLTHQAWDTIGLPPGGAGAGTAREDEADVDAAATAAAAAPRLDAERNDALGDEEFELLVEQIASVLEYRLAEIVQRRKEAERASGRSTPTSGGTGTGGLGGGGATMVRRRSNESLDRARRRRSNEGAVQVQVRGGRRPSNDSHASAGSAGSGRSGVSGGNAGRVRQRRHSTASSVDVIYVSPMCRAELREYVRRIGRRYRPCRYHSLRHAAHVTLSANKLLDLLDERWLPPEEYDCCTYVPETEQLYDCASSSSIELDHKFQRELRRLSLASRASASASASASSGRRRGSDVSAATGGGGGGGGGEGSSSGGRRRGSHASGLGGGGGPTWRRRRSSTGGTGASFGGAHPYRRRSSAAGSAAVRRGSLSSIMSVAVSEADVDSVLSPSVVSASVSDTSSQQRMRRRRTQEHVRTAQGVNLRPGQRPAPRRNSTGSDVSGASSAGASSANSHHREPRISTARARAARRQSFGTHCSSAASSASSVHGRPSGPKGASPGGQGRQRRRHSVHGASRDVWESCSSHGTAAQGSQADGTTTIANDDGESSHRDEFDADASFGLADDPDSELKPLPHRSSTFGIATDPIIKFCLVYAALIHDVDHQGIPNRQLSRENHPLALLYNDKSIAEQNSLKVAFSTLMDPRFAELRHTLCPTSEDQFEFRRIVIDLVMCTDIASPERMQITKSKWAEAFGTKAARPSDDGMRAVSHTPASSSSEAIATVTASRPRLVSLRRNSVGTNPTRQYNRRAKDGGKLGIKRALHLKGSTIEFYSTSGDTDDPEAVEVRLRSSSVLELMMNAADVAHTMQSFENFVKWNKRLYEELHEAYESGRCADGEEDDPSKDWFGNQLGFYEIYILPLARRLRKCGAFAPDAAEAFVQNAKNICRRWEYEGAAITDRIIEEVRREYEERTNGGGAAAREASLEKVDEENRSSIGSSSCASDHSAALKSFEKAEPGN